MENSSINFESSKDIIKKNMISRVESIDDATSKDKFFEYLNDNNISYEEKKIVKNKNKEDNEYFKKRNSSAKIGFIITYLICYPLCFYLFDLKNNISESIFAAILLFLCISIYTFVIFFRGSSGEIKYRNQKASPEDLKDLYIKVFKENINDYLPLNSEELKQLYNSNEFIKAYVDKNPDEIFTRYSLNNVAGIKMNNLHMINEFKDIIDNKKMLIGLPEGQKIVVHNLIKKEQKL